MSNHGELWKVWKYALGSYSDDKTSPYDNYIAIIRTVIFVSYMVTNAFIITGVLNSLQEVKTPIYAENRVK